MQTRMIIGAVFTEVVIFSTVFGIGIRSWAVDG